MIKNSDNTESAKLFIRFCKENKIIYKRIPTETYRTPDLEIYIGNIIIYVEIVQFENIKRGYLFWSNSENRVRNKITKAKKQIKQRIITKGKNPSIVVMYDLGTVDSIDSIDIKSAMFGKESVEVYLHDNKVIEDRELFLGKNKKMTKNTNTSISALATLVKWPGDALHLNVYLNHFAKIGINPDWLRNDNIHYYKLNDNCWTEI